MRTGMSQGPRGLRDVSKINEPLNLDFSLEESVRKSILAATWLDDVDLGAAKEAVMLAETMDQFPDRRHQAHRGDGVQRPRQERDAYREPQLW